MLDLKMLTDVIRIYAFEIQIHTEVLQKCIARNAGIE